MFENICADKDIEVCKYTYLSSYLVPSIFKILKSTTLKTIGKFFIFVD